VFKERLAIHDFKNATKTYTNIFKHVNKMTLNGTANYRLGPKKAGYGKPFLGDQALPSSSTLISISSPTWLLKECVIMVALCNRADHYIFAL